MAQCTICESRKAKRYCTARGEDICAQCCATEREVSINCPYECGYLRESRLHEKRDLTQVEMPHADVQIDQEFLENAQLVLMLMSAFLNGALKDAPNATDADARQFLEAQVARWRAALAGEEKEFAPEGAVARGIHERFAEKMGPFMSELKDRESGVFADRVFLGVAVFMTRVAKGHDNGRPHCRSYVHYLRSTFPDAPAGAEAAE
jgi:hypothetical protein